MQPIFDAVDQLYTDANNDDDLRQWFSELDSYLRRVLQEPGYIMKDTCGFSLIPDVDLFTDLIVI